MTIKHQKTSVRSVVLAMILSVIMILGTAVTAFAATDVIFTTNGAKGNYIPGSSLMVYGRVETQGIGIPGTSAFVEVVLENKPVFYG
ncbi:MAG: hypothetical protein RR361_04680, partial [Anaerovorax sp.]